MRIPSPIAAARPVAVVAGLTLTLLSCLVDRLSDLAFDAGVQLLRWGAPDRYDAVMREIDPCMDEAGTLLDRVDALRERAVRKAANRLGVPL